MPHIDYFKLQAKNLFRDYQTQTSYNDDVDGNLYYKYDPKYFDIERIFLEFNCDEKNLSLMKVQHLFAVMLGFKKWTDLLKASDPRQELARLLFDHQEKIHIEDWKMYIAGAERDNEMVFDDHSRLDILKEVFVNRPGHSSPFGDYRLNKRQSKSA